MKKNYEPKLILVPGLFLILILISVVFLLPRYAKADYEISDGSVIGLWHLDNNSLDSSGNNINGTDSNINYTSSSLGQKANFNGLNSKIDFSSSTALNLQTFSEMMIVNLSSSQISKIFLANFSNTGAVGQAIGISDATQNKIKFYTERNPAGSDTLETTILDSNKDYYIVATFDGYHKSIYLNGNLVATSSWPYQIGYANVSSSLGYLPQANSQYLNGSLDEVVFLNKVLTQTEITAIYNNGVFQKICIVKGCATNVAKSQFQSIWFLILNAGLLGLTAYFVFKIIN